MKATAIAPSNIAFIKYWGKKDEELKIPENGSISMNLSNLLTTTTVEFNSEYRQDLVIINDQSDLKESARVIKFLDQIRQKANIFQKAKVVSKNNFPDGTGLSSSASGFAALTVAGVTAAGLDLHERELSIMARFGSGSACRSIPSGFVEWLKGDSNDTSYSVSIFPPDYFNILDIVAIISNKKKLVSSTDGQKIARTSPFFNARLTHIDNKIKEIKKFIKLKDFKSFGLLIEEEALELHKIMQTSTPSLMYWQPETIKLMDLVRNWRSEGLEVYFTVNTGQDIHLIIEEKSKKMLVEKLQNVKEVKKIIINQPAVGARLTEKHLF